MRYLISLIVVLIGIGCTSQLTLTSEQQILAALDSYHTAERAGDLEVILDTYSEEFEDSQGTNKDALAGFFGVLVDQGLLKGLIIDMDAMVISVEDAVRRSVLFPIPACLDQTPIDTKCGRRKIQYGDSSLARN